MKYSTFLDHTPCPSLPSFPSLPTSPEEKQQMLEMLKRLEAEQSGDDSGGGTGINSDSAQSLEERLAGLDLGE